MRIVLKGLMCELWPEEGSLPKTMFLILGRALFLSGFPPIVSLLYCLIKRQPFTVPQSIFLVLSGTVLFSLAGLVFHKVLRPIPSLADHR